MSPRLPVRGRARATALLAAATLATALPAAPPPATPLPELDARFRPTAAWAGGDACYTVDLGRGRVLWLFGDTFVGPVRGGRRAEPTMVRNSLAVQAGPDLSGASLRFHVPRDPEGAPRAVWSPPGEAWYWPLDGARTPEGLHLFMGVFEATEGGGAFGFRRVATDLLVIEDPDAPPGQWEARTLRLRFAVEEPGGGPWFGAALLEERGYLYVYGHRDRAGPPPRRELVVARAPRRALARPELWRFWDGDSWEASPGRAAGLIPDSATELSVAPHPEGGAVLTYTPMGLSPEVAQRAMAGPVGPFGPREVVFRCPEHDPEAGVLCYAAKAHPRLASPPGTRVVTYVANAADLATVVDDVELYRPRFLSAPLPAPRARRGPRAASGDLGRPGGRW